MQPAYVLPENLVDALCEEKRAQGDGYRSKRLLTEPDEKAERDFTAACKTFLPDTVGVWRGQPVRYPYLFDVEPNLGVDSQQTRMLMECGMTEQQIQASLQKLEPGIVRTRHQLLGYVGFLTFNKQFIEELRVLQKLWQELSPNSVLPQTSASLLASPVPFQQLPGFERLSEDHQSFCTLLRELITKWELCGFAT